MSAKHSNPHVDALTELLTSAWSNALHTEIGAESDVLALGATSIAAAAVAAAVAEQYPDCDGIEVLALQAVFEAPNVGAIAEMLAAFVAQQRAR